MALTDWASVATILMGTAAILGLLFAYRQTIAFTGQAKHARSQHLEALAKDHYQTFLTLCIEYPEFSVAELINPAIDVEKRTFAGDAERFAQYEWFTVSAENAFESIYLTVGHEEHWRETIRSILKEHLKYMVSSRYREMMQGTSNSRYQVFVDNFLLEQSKQ